MKEVVIIHLGDGEELSAVTFLGQEVQIHRIGCHGDTERARAVIGQYDGLVDAIGLEGYPAELELGGVRVAHEIGAALPAAASQTPVVDGGGIRPGLERWAVILADRAGAPRFCATLIPMPSLPCLIFPASAASVPWSRQSIPRWTT